MSASQIKNAVQASVQHAPAARAGPSASAVVRKTLVVSGECGPAPLPFDVLTGCSVRNAGPQTTGNLHATLHSLYPASLPVRPPPSSFLAGARRTLQARKLGIAPSSLPLTRDNFPGKDESSAGRWSMSYLKNRVLKPMEERGEVLKLTRGRWDRLAPSTDAPEETADDAVSAATGKQGDGKGKKTAKRDYEEHVWVTRDMYDERNEMGKDGRQQAAEVKLRVDRVEGDIELREKYGLPSR